MTTAADRQRRRIRAAFGRTRLEPEELWVRYFALGGQAGPADLAEFLDGTSDLPVRERDRVALAVNEELDRITGSDRAPYSRPLRAAEPEGGPLAALVTLLRDTHLSPPDSLPAAIDAAGRHLGVVPVLYLADDGARTLVPLPGGPGHGREPLSVDGTLPGRAYRVLQTQPAVSEDGQARLWVPVVDGAERVGVLDVMLADPADLDDPNLHRHCWWLAHYLGHLVTALASYGDALEVTHPAGSRSARAELIHRLLPPSTAGTGRVLVAGRVEPAHDMGGDLFDYALSATRAQFAVLDATGHDLRAGLAVAAAVSAYRAARRAGAGLFEQVEAVHGTVAEHFAGNVFATAVVAELDLLTGRLRYLSAGHPAPLLLRAGKVVKQLDDGRRPLLGIDVRSTTVGEEHLQQGDTVVVHTDGITRARDRTGRTFGLGGLVDVLQRTAAEGTPLPEVTRRVVAAILDHHQGALQDDATLLMVQWTTEGQDALDPAPR
ncbi:serine/threonine-protein phosphatase [Cellulomonas sp. zg-ZUI199]|uniref:Serine/threonine-protein phosphatase n=1 Tax=Cellulomonas wangleii TaxID=2816956 RepID=A0ABX8D9L0_9CELL|nr:PP2C family protein-serine/threonine phosphatase [Cellulomonas wangleii]MBO0926393.1 serine/threonine-protein phosphatase [Cellulomonas wangleii]QVI63931.1 serine/threonine-protein phosphatase [Cellulomonas wangleii]